MGEHKLREQAAALLQHVADQGKILELGWKSFEDTVIPKGAPDIQVSEMRKAFYCGAAHLYSSVMIVLDPGEEATERDLQRMRIIHDELEAFKMEATTWFKPGQG
jgi:hypothetical protein